MQSSRKHASLGDPTGEVLLASRRAWRAPTKTEEEACLLPHRPTRGNPLRPLRVVQPTPDHRVVHHRERLQMGLGSSIQRSGEVRRGRAPVDAAPPPPPQHVLQSRRARGRAGAAARAASPPLPPRPVPPLMAPPSPDDPPPHRRRRRRRVPLSAQWATPPPQANNPKPSCRLAVALSRPPPHTWGRGSCALVAVDAAAPPPLCLPIASSARRPSRPKTQSEETNWWWRCRTWRWRGRRSTFGGIFA